MLIAGIPRVYTPAGVLPTSVSVTSGTTVDPLWWPGTGTLTETLPDASTFNPVRDLLDPAAVWEVYEQLDPLKGEVSVEAMRLELYDDGDRASATLSARNSYPERLLTSDISATALSVPLSSVTGLASSGIACVGRETFLYDSISGSSLVVPTGGRGRYGSVARSHAAPALRQPVVTIGGARHPQGRAATVWVCELSASGLVLRNPTLIFFGVVGPGVQLTRAGMRWSVPLDPMTVAGTARISGREIELWGINHHTRPFSGGLRTPLYALAQGPSSSSEIFLDGSVDGGLPGWHPSWAAFAESWSDRAQTLAATGPRVELATAQRVTVSGYWGSSNGRLEVVAEWSTSPTILSGSSPQTWTSSGPAPEAYVPLDGWVTIPSPDDLAKIPTTLSYVSASPYDGTARLSLVADTTTTEGVAFELLERDGTDSKVRVVIAGISDASGTVYDASVSALVVKPTTAQIGVIARGPEAWGALRALALAVAGLDGLDVQVETIDWEHLVSQARQSPLSSIPSQREYRIGPGDESLLSLLSDELRLRGMVLSLRHGRMTGVRYGHFAATEIVAADLDETDCVDAEWEMIDQPVPAATAVRYTLPDGSTFQVVDATWMSELGAGETIECGALTHLPVYQGLSAIRTGLVESAQQLLGPLAEPARHLTLPLTGEHLALQPGDLVTVTHSRVPDFEGGRGITDVVAQIVAVRRQYFGGRLRAAVEMRLSSEAFQGYAPSALVAAGGISGAVVTVDTSSGFGTTGFADDGRAATDGFVAGDVVELCEIGVYAPTIAREQRTVVSVTATTVTLSSAPSASMLALAASAYKVMLRYTDHGDAVAAQYPYAFLADTTPDLTDGSVDRWAP
jgi:hypothetical protein